MLRLQSLMELFKALGPLPLYPSQLLGAAHRQGSFAPSSKSCQTMLSAIERLGLQLHLPHIIWLSLLGGDGSATLDELGHTPPAISQPWARIHVRWQQVLYCEEPSPARIAPCTAALCSTASSGLMDLFGSLPLKNSWIMDCTFGIQVEPPTSTKSCMFFCSIPLSRRPLSTRPWNYGSRPCKAPQSVLETTSTSS